MSTSVVARTLAHLAAEVEGVKSDPTFDIAASTLQKSRLLAELQRLPAGSLDLDTAKTLQAAIRTNAGELAAQLGAVRQINELIADAMRADLCDGTYALPGARA